MKNSFFLKGSYYIYSTKDYLVVLRGICVYLTPRIFELAAIFFKIDREECVHPRHAFKWVRFHIIWI